jgi:hypothetical protein
MQEDALFYFAIILMGDDAMMLHTPDISPPNSSWTPETMPNASLWFSHQNEAVDFRHGRHHVHDRCSRARAGTCFCWGVAF